MIRHLKGCHILFTSTYLVTVELFGESNKIRKSRETFEPIDWLAFWKASSSQHVQAVQG
jgi:hypothetical protein